VKSILVVEDDSDTREAMQLALGLQYNVTTASDGAEALRILRCGFRPDLIFCDLQMPTMDGREFCLTWHEDEDIQTIPVVLLSADCSGAEVAANVGATRFIPKPASLSELLTTVESLTLQFKDPDRIMV
jgi:chemotaxis family two-component system sensor histidine kinase/response regulator PixL